jgi:hypothetical protein
LAYRRTEGKRPRRLRADGSRPMQATWLLVSGSSRVSEAVEQFCYADLASLRSSITRPIEA